MSPRLVLFEGLPGSGKTTTSRRVADRLAACGVPCEWSFEEQRDHPVLDTEVRKRHRRSDYDQSCIASWRAFLETARATTWVLEGCALQSTVRFMVEQVWPFERIRSYWDRFEQLLSRSHFHVSFVYLSHPDPHAFVQGHLMLVRADVWPRISSHVRSTPAGTRIANEGGDPSVEFWVEYRDVCDRLLAGSTLPRIDIDIGEGWAGVEDRVVKWLCDQQFAP